MLDKTVVTTKVEKACAIKSDVTGVTVSTLDWVVDGTTGTAEVNETDVDEAASIVTAATAAILGGAIVLETAVKTEFVTAVDGVIVTLNACCANKLETG